jgi:hypothetical protein
VIVVVVEVVVVVDTGASGSQLTVEDRTDGDVEHELRIPAATTTVNPRRTSLPFMEST